MIGPLMLLRTIGSNGWAISSERGGQRLGGCWVSLILGIIGVFIICAVTKEWWDIDLPQVALVIVMVVVTAITGGFL